MKDSISSVLELVGNTPLVKLRSLSGEFQTGIYGKLEFMNPSMSMKDRVILYIIEKAEKDGLLKPGMMLVDATSGNTGLSIALIALLKGYRCTLTVKDSSAQAKIQQLQLYGARVIKCPAGVPPDHPLSYYSVARRIVEENDDAFFVDQNYNPLHFEAHYHGLGAEIWRQTGGKITHFFGSASTGGSISGAGAYLKEKNKDIKVVCADSHGSVLKPYHETGVYRKELKKKTPLEGVGKDIIPGVFRPEYIDDCIEVDNGRSVRNALNLLQQEGLFIGGSGGAAIDALIQYFEKNPAQKGGIAVVNFPDHGIKYMGKLYKIEKEAENAADLFT